MEFKRSKMKLLLSLFLLLAIIALPVVAFSVDNSTKLSTKERADRASLSIRFRNYTEKKALGLPKTVEQDLEKLAELKLDTKQDFELVYNALKTLLTVDVATVDGEPFDPARDMAQNLTLSYQKHKALYDAAFEKLRTDKNKENIEGLKKLWNNLGKKGNG